MKTISKQIYKVLLSFVIFLLLFDTSNLFSQQVRKGDDSKINSTYCSGTAYSTVFELEQPIVAVQSHVRIQNEHKKSVLVDDVKIEKIGSTELPQHENSIFRDPVDPSFILVSNKSGPLASANSGADHFYSTDWGNSGTWEGSYLGLSYDYDNNGDPCTAMDDSRSGIVPGKIYVGYLDQYNNTNHSVVSVSQGIFELENNNISLTWETSLATPYIQYKGYDKPHLHIDNLSSTDYHGNLYLGAEKLNLNDGVHISLDCYKSNDGLNWQGPICLDCLTEGIIGTKNNGVNLKTNLDGTIFATWFSYTNTSETQGNIAFNKSTDGGDTFSEPYSITSTTVKNTYGFSGTSDLANRKLNPFPVMSIDNSNGPFKDRIYIVYNEWMTYWFSPLLIGQFNL